MVNALGEKLPQPAVDFLGKAFAGPAYYRFLADYRGWIQVEDERLELDGETHWEYMVMNLRRGQIPRPAPTLNL